ncbi:ribonucleoprotein PTB-binding 1 isoform X2 [Corvus hawaiiensis]|uniref:ribonucleoprotein PTB-binding 1 isoform X2 n=1 Tax=Corvus hawaiiensis TaxID=134902 RepID=UPI002019D3DE|nr:ribonucleoprotein PTB-binding 1 isoform X2 [Corvus hawaiiensis]
MDFTANPPFFPSRNRESWAIPRSAPWPAPREAPGGAFLRCSLARGRGPGTREIQILPKSAALASFLAQAGTEREKLGTPGTPPGPPALGSALGAVPKSKQGESGAPAVSLLGEPPKDLRIPLNPYLNLRSLLPTPALPGAAAKGFKVKPGVLGTPRLPAPPRRPPRLGIPAGFGIPDFSPEPRPARIPPGGLREHQEQGLLLLLGLREGEFGSPNSPLFFGILQFLLHQRPPSRPQAEPPQQDPAGRPKTRLFPPAAVARAQPRGLLRGPALAGPRWPLRRLLPEEKKDLLTPKITPKKKKKTKKKPPSGNAAQTRLAFASFFGRFSPIFGRFGAFLEGVFGVFLGFWQNWVPILGFRMPPPHTSKDFFGVSGGFFSLPSPQQHLGAPKKRSLP